MKLLSLLTLCVGANFELLPWYVLCSMLDVLYVVNGFAHAFRIVLEFFG